MAKPTGDATHWPALDLQGRELPAHIAFEKGVWGKVHGAPSDFRWIAATRAFMGTKNHLERDLPLGTEDLPVSATLWRTHGDTCYAIALYPSRVHDAAGRSGFLEKQFLEWKRSPEVPAALGALLLMDIAAKAEAEARERQNDVRWSDDDVIELEAASTIPVSRVMIEEAAERGLADLVQATTEESLANLYAAVLAGERAIQLKGLPAPLSPAAVAALLLPLPREVADRLSIAGWLPSSRLSESGIEDVRRTWDLVLGGGVAIPSTSAAPTAEQIEQAGVMAKSVFSRPPAGRVQTPGGAASEASEEIAKTIQLTLWGPSAAGKTVLLAKLYLEADDDETAGGWEVFPTERSVNFIDDMRARMQTNNLFPPASTFGHVEGIEYLFRNAQTGVVASLQLEDRAGRESEALEDTDITGGKMSLKRRLGSADGIVLLFDPVSDTATLEGRFWNTLELLHVASGRKARKDPRPIAVCVSKSDVLIETPEDFRRAIESPDEFVRERAPEFLTNALDRFCTNYRLFPVSAAGVRLRHGVIEPAVFFDESLERRICPGGRPFNLMAPFSWLLGELGSA